LAGYGAWKSGSNGYDAHSYKTALAAAAIRRANKIFNRLSYAAVALSFALLLRMGTMEWLNPESVVNIGLLLIFTTMAASGYLWAAEPPPHEGGFFADTSPSEA
jgi:hypothetical protein